MERCESSGRRAVGNPTCALYFGNIRCTAVHGAHSLQDDALLAAAVQADRNQSGAVEEEGLTKHKKDKCRHLSDYPLQPTAQLGLSSGEYTLEVEGWFTCYSSSDYESGALHTALLGKAAPLAASTRYYYRYLSKFLGRQVRLSTACTRHLGGS